MLSIDILPVPTDEAVREVQNKLLGVETNAANWQRRQNAVNNFSAMLPYDIEQQRAETKEMLGDLTNRDQRMMFGLVTMVHLADTKEQLDSDTESLLTVARKHLCQMSILRWQQKDGLDTVLPYGLRKITALRTLTTESTAVFIPFRAQEIMQDGGIYYGQNAVSKNMIVADRRKLLNGNSFRLGVSGSGKSFSAKEEIVSIALSTNDDILILDPESEFGVLTQALGGEVIHVSATAPTHLNAMDMDRSYGDDRNPLIEKSQFILSLFEQLAGAEGISAKEKVDPGPLHLRGIPRLHRPRISAAMLPTLKDLYLMLLKQPEPEAQRPCPFSGIVHHRQFEHLCTAHQRQYQRADHLLRYPGTGRAADAHRDAGHARCDLQPGHPELEAGQDHLGVCRRVLPSLPLSVQR